jgi:hypothetical protein
MELSDLAFLIWLFITQKLIILLISLLFLFFALRNYIMNYMLWIDFRMIIVVNRKNRMARLRKVSFIRDL